jgi:4a-hydroxytetrahydrobiopterin dehydratase
MTLAQKNCLPCEGIGTALTEEQALGLLKQTPAWEISPNKRLIFRQLSLKNFMSAIKLINAIATIAEAENHHPDFHLSNYRHLQITLSTHVLKGLTENDFIVAAKINQLPLELKA